jgi:hypothetical protein
MVRRGTNWDGRTDLVVLNRGTLTGKRYIDYILDNQIRLYAGADGDQLMDDNARPHRARVVKDYLEREFIERSGSHFLICHVDIANAYIRRHLREASSFT